MSATIEPLGKTLRHSVQERVALATDAEIEAVHRMFLEMEANTLWRDLRSGVAEDWKSGRLTVEGVDHAIAARRQRLANK